jgi:hypothetical protein
MATIEERFDSNEGMSGGMRGVSATRRFNVTLTTADGDDYPNNAIKPVRDLYPIGDAHPLNSDLIVWQHTQTRRERNTVGRWIVEVDYQLPLAGDPASQAAIDTWQVEYSTVLETEQLARSWLLDERGNRTGLSDIPVGTRVYKDDANGAYSVTTPDGVKMLARIDDNDIVVPASLRAFAQVTSFVMRRTVANVNLQQLMDADTFVGKVNATRFVTGEPGQVLCGPYRVSSRAGTIEGQTQIAPGIVYDIELNFVKNAKGWRSERIYDRFRIGEFEATVRHASTGREQYRDFERHELAELNNMPKIFGPMTKTPNPRLRP